MVKPPEFNNGYNLSALSDARACALNHYTTQFLSLPFLKLKKMIGNTRDILIRISILHKSMNLKEKTQIIKVYSSQ